MNLRNIAIWVVIGVVLVALYGMMNQSAKTGASPEDSALATGRLSACRVLLRDGS